MPDCSTLLTIGKFCSSKSSSMTFLSLCILSAPKHKSGIPHCNLMSNFHLRCTQRGRTVSYCRLVRVAMSMPVCNKVHFVTFIGSHGLLLSEKSQSFQFFRKIKAAMFSSINQVLTGQTNVFTINKYHQKNMNLTSK